MRYLFDTARCRAVLLLVVGLMLSIATLAQAADVQYVYDELGRLVEVVAPDGTSAQYSYDAVGNIVAIQKNVTGTPSIAEFTPNSGPVGTVVAVYGSGFDTTAANNTVTFNGVQASVSAATATSLTVTVPTGATTGKIGVTTATGSATSATDYQVAAVLAAPTITSFTPTIGVAGSTVTISGTNYDTIAANDRVELNGRFAAISSTAATSIAATVPDNTSSGKIQVATPYGSVTSSTDFFIPPPPYTASDIEVTDRMAIGDTKTVTIGTLGKKALILFDGSQGKALSLSLSSVTISSGTISILNPDGTVQASGSLSSSSQFLEAQTLPVTGTYTILIDPASASSGSVTLHINDYQDVTDTITPGGAAVTATTILPGQNASLSFSGTAGQRISIHLSTPSLSNGYYVDMSIIKPDGTLLMPVTHYSWDNYIDVQTLPATGTYTVKLDPVDMAVGSMAVQLYDVPADITGSISIGGPVVNVTTTPGQNASLSFSGTAGQRISLHLPTPTLSNGYYVDMTIFKPDGTALAPMTYYTWDKFIDVQTLPVTGTYTIKLDPEDMAAGSMSAQLYDVPADITGSITVGGAAVTVTTTAPGQSASLSFSGTAGQRISLSLPTPSLSNGYYVDLTILKPDGSALSYTTSYAWDRFIDVQTLPATGTYTLKLDPEDMASGSMTAQIYDVPADISGSIAIGGSTVTVNPATPGQNASLSFSGSAGQQVTVHLANSTIGCQTLYLYNPDGSQLTAVAPCGTSYDLTQTLSVTGTNSIVIDPSGANTGSADISLTSP